MRETVRLWGAEGEDNNVVESETVTVTSDPTPETRILTEEEINRMVTRAADRGSRKAAKALAQDLGFDSPSEAKAWFSEQQAAADATKSEETKALEEARAAAAEAEVIVANARNDRLALRIDREVLRAGVTDEKRASRIATLIRTDLDPDLEEDDWTDNISTLLEEMKDETPEMFGKPASHGSGDGGATGNSSTSNDQEKREEQWAAEWRAKGFIEQPTA